MATKLAVIVADFTTQLASAMAVAATTASLQSATDDDGVALPAGVYFFAIDGNNSQKEHIVATLSGTSLTGISSVSRQGVQSSGVVRTHRVGSTVTLTDFAHIRYMNDLLSGATSFDASSPLGYDGTASITTANQFATKAYVDGVAIAGAPNSSTTVKGIGKLSTAPVSGTNPIFVGDNDTRVPTAAQTAAAAGNDTSIAVGSGNKFVTQTGSQIGAETYIASTGSANAYVAAFSPIPIALVAGMQLTFKANFTNTGAATLNPNSLGATAIKKFGATALVAGDIISGQIVQAEYDGTNFQLLSTPSVLNTKIGNKLAFDLTGASVINTIVETTVFTGTVPANTLSTGNAIRVRCYVSGIFDSAGGTYTVNAKYGGTTVASSGSNKSAGGSSAMNGFFEFILFASAATNAQAGELLVLTAEAAGNTGTSNNCGNGSGTSAVDSTASQILLITIQWTDSTGQITVRRTTAEIIAI